jgi:hypothetical protein
LANEAMTEEGEADAKPGDPNKSGGS